MQNSFSWAQKLNHFQSSTHCSKISTGSFGILLPNKEIFGHCREKETARAVDCSFFSVDNLNLLNLIWEFSSGKELRKVTRSTINTFLLKETAQNVTYNCSRNRGGIVMFM